MSKYIITKRLSSVWQIVFMIYCQFAQAADGAILFNKTNYMELSKESISLNAEERKTLQLFRSKPEAYASTTVIAMNRASLGSGLLTIQTPDGKQFQYLGGMGTSEGTRGVWTGKSKSRGVFTISQNDEGAFGQINEGEKIYQIQSLPGKRFYFITEVVPQSIDEGEKGDGSPLKPIKTPQFGGK